MTEPTPLEQIDAAIRGGYQNKLLFVVGGGLGDRVCAEPTLRWAIQNFYGVDVSLACDTPELFTHLKFANVYDLKRTFPASGSHLVLKTYHTTGLAAQFMNPNLIHCVDYPALSSMMMTLPNRCKRIRLEPSHRGYLLKENIRQQVLIHPGKTWESRTFPAAWWEKVIELVKRSGMIPVVVGNNTVDVKVPEGVQDLRNQTCLNDMIWRCMNARAVITNDSSPIHFAAGGTSRIAYVPTCRRPDLLTHHREGGFGWRQAYFCGEKMWEGLDYCPNTLDIKRVDLVPEGKNIEDFLPNPATIVKWIDTE